MPKESNYNSVHLGTNREIHTYLPIQCVHYNGGWRAGGLEGWRAGGLEGWIVGYIAGVEPLLAISQLVSEGG